MNKQKNMVEARKNAKTERNPDLSQRGSGAGKYTGVPGFQLHPPKGKSGQAAGGQRASRLAPPTGCIALRFRGEHAGEVNLIDYY